MNKVQLERKYILKAVSDSGNIPIDILTFDGYLERLEKAEQEAKKRILGQDDTLTKLFNDIKTRQKEWFEDHDKQIKELNFNKTAHQPRFSAIFLGETGVGKTETAKIISEVLYNGNLLTLNGQDVAHSHLVSSWVGTSPGYVGHGEGGSLTRGIKENKFSLINFDEIEKANPIAIKEVLLSLLSDSKVTDKNTGEELDASQTMIIATSNIPLEKKQTFGFKNSSNQALAYKDAYSSLREFFPPEIIGRFNGIYIFNSLELETRYEILKKFLNKYAEEKNRSFTFEPEAELFIRRKLAEIKTGARGIIDFATANITPLFFSSINKSLNFKLAYNQLVIETEDNLMKN